MRAAAKSWRTPPMPTTISMESEALALKNGTFLAAGGLREQRLAGRSLSGRCRQYLRCGLLEHGFAHLARWR